MSLLRLAPRSLNYAHLTSLYTLYSILSGETLNTCFGQTFNWLLLPGHFHSLIILRFLFFLPSSVFTLFQCDRKACLMSKDAAPH